MIYPGIELFDEAGISKVARAQSRNLEFVPFTLESISERYLGWLGDPEVNRYSQRQSREYSREEAAAFLASLRSEEQVLAVRLRDTETHIGNLQLGPVHLGDARGEVRILLGDRTQWGKGYAKQAIHFACCYYFFVLKFHRVEALSWHPGFRGAVESLNWKLEGTMRERIFDGRRWNDYFAFGILASEFIVVPEYLP